MSGQVLDRLPPQVVLWGGTGQAKVARPIIEHYGSRVAAVIDDTPDLVPPFSDVDLFCGWAGFEQWLAGRTNLDRIGFCIAIGNPHGRIRLSLHDRLSAVGLTPVSFSHPTAWIDDNVSIGEGAQIMAGAIILSEAVIGRQCIVNTKASVDHKSRLGAGSEVAPGATLCGSVSTGTNVWVGAGATILPRLVLGEDCVIGAGSVVVRNVPSSVTVVGAPSRPISKSKGPTT